MLLPVVMPGCKTDSQGLCVYLSERLLTASSTNKQTKPINKHKNNKQANKTNKQANKNDK